VSVFRDLLEGARVCIGLAGGGPYLRERFFGGLADLRTLLGPEEAQGVSERESRLEEQEGRIALEAFEQLVEIEQVGIELHHRDRGEAFAGESEAFNSPIMCTSVGADRAHLDEDLDHRA
jgi:hypothetical protein